VTRGLRGLLAAVLVLGGLAGVVPPAGAQDIGVVQSDILVLDPERLFEQTRLGRNMRAEHQAKREELAARNRKLESELEAEEQRLTDLRAETAPEDFRDMADAFDEKVQKLRRDSERRVRDLERERERLPLMFLRAVEPVLTDLMRNASGVVLLDARTVLFRADAVDITDTAIARIDAEIGDSIDTPPATDGDDGE